MSLSVLQVAQRGVGIYEPAFAFDSRLQGEDYAGSTVGVDMVDNAMIIAFRGTDTREDILKDIEAALPEPAGELGGVALGFFSGVQAVYERLKVQMLGRRVIVTGHSLGAAQACDFAAWAAYHGLPCYGAVLMGCPKPGGTDLNFWLDKLPVWYSFRNGADPVCDVPTWGFLSRPVTTLNEPGPPDQGLIGWHHSALYLQGIAKLQLAPVLP